MSWPVRLCLRWRASTRDLGGEEVGPFNTFPTTEHTSFHSPPSFSFPSNILLRQLLSCPPDLPPTCVFIQAFLFLPLLTSLRPPSSLLLITMWLIHSLLFPFNKRCRCTTTDLLPPSCPRLLSSHFYRLTEYKSSFTFSSIFTHWPPHRGHDIDFDLWLWLADLFSPFSAVFIRLCYKSTYPQSSRRIFYFASSH